MSLPVLTDYQEDESDISFVVRLVKGNTLNGIGDVLGHMGKSDRRGISFSAIYDYADVLSDKTGLSKDLFESIGFKNHSRNQLCHEAYGVLPRKAVERTYLRFCPKCLRSSGYYKTHWTIKAVLACAKHYVRLIEYCPNCHRQIRIVGPSLFYCPCGQDLKSVQSELANFPERISANFVTTNMTRSSSGVGRDMLPHHVSALSNNEKLNVLEFVARHLVQPRHNESGSVYALNPQIRHAVLEGAYQLFFEYPRQFYDAVEEQFCTWQEVPKKREIAFGNFYKAISDSRSIGHVFYEDMEKFCSERVPELSASLRGKRKTGIQKYSQYLTLAEAAAYTGWSKGRILQLIQNGDIHDRPMDYGKVQVHRIFKEDLDGILMSASETASKCGYSYLSKVLGLSVPVVREMFKAGILIDAYSADANVQRLEKQVIQNRVFVGNDGISMRRALYGYCRRNGVSTVELIQSLFEPNDLVRELKIEQSTFSDRVMMNLDVVRRLWG